MEKSEEIKNLILQAADALNKGDARVVQNALSHNELTMLIGSDPTEWVVGYDTIIGILDAQVENLPKSTISLDKIFAFSEGSLGWFVYNGVQKFETGSEMPMRVNGVLHKENGAWKIVFINYTIEVPNEKMGLILDKWPS